ncbi:hypothetical protein [Saccharothrix sp. Mg75]|uniref:hypothetical protein n=1 Tax=Saccharothrix sp. Mg75 TaxID=3445357 RepID=UPI003EEBA3CF
MAKGRFHDRPGSVGDLRLSKFGLGDGGRLGGQEDLCPAGAVHGVRAAQVASVAVVGVVDVVPERAVELVSEVDAPTGWQHVFEHLSLGGPRFAARPVVRSADLAGQQPVVAVVWLQVMSGSLRWLYQSVARVGISVRVIFPPIVEVAATRAGAGVGATGVAAVTGTATDFLGSIVVVRSRPLGVADALLNADLAREPTPQQQGGAGPGPSDLRPPG